MGIVVLCLSKNTSLLNDSLAYHMTVARGVGGGINVGGGASQGSTKLVLVVFKRRTNSNLTDKSW